MSRNRLAYVSLAAAAGAFFVITGCDARTTPGRDGGNRDGASAAMCTPGIAGFICDGNTAVQCLADGSEGARTSCAETGQICVPGPGPSGCNTCRPSTFQCNGNNVERCNAEGTGWMPQQTCDAAAGQMCNAVTGVCSSPCADAATSNSYIGCEYWPTPAANPVAIDFDFAVVVANPQTTPVTVTVTRAGAAVATATVPASGLETIRLPWVDEYKLPVSATGTTQSALVRGGAYRLRSTLPVTVYQFNPLEYRVTAPGGVFDDGCSGSDSPIPDGFCFAFSNDASLLLPSHVLTGNYIAMSERTRHVSCPSSGQFQSTPGFVTIVGVSPSPVTVNVQLRGRTAASADGTVAAGVSGDTQTYSLNQGDVLQLASAAVGSSCTPNGTTAGQCGGADMTHCAVTDDYDLTGTEIRATGPVMVLGGHTCAMLPTNRFACDHIEETIFPLESWGDDFVVSATQPLRGEPNIVRVMSGADGNSITFDPGSVNAAATLNRGDVLEFETTEDFRVTGTGPLMVAQFLVGQNYAGSVEEEGQGDPAMSFAIPTEQFRTQYTFLAPSTFERNFVNVTAPVGATVTLDGTQVSGWRTVGASGMQTARVEIPGGAHTISSSQGFGIVVYGFGSYTSYMYPGGLNFEDINPLI